MELPTLSYLDGFWAFDEGALADPRRNGSRLRASGMSRELPLACLEQLLRPEGATLPPTGALLELGHYLHLSAPSMATGRAVLDHVKDAVLEGRLVLMGARHLGDIGTAAEAKLPQARATAPAAEPRGTFSIRLEVDDLAAWQGTKVRLVGDDGRDWLWTVLEPHPNAIGDAAFVFRELNTSGTYSLELVQPGHTPRWLFRDVSFDDLPNAEHHQRLPEVV